MKVQIFEGVWREREITFKMLYKGPQFGIYFYCPQQPFNIFNFFQNDCQVIDFLICTKKFQFQSNISLLAQKV